MKIMQIDAKVGRAEGEAAELLVLGFENAHIRSRWRMADGGQGADRAEAVAGGGGLQFL